MSGNSGLTRAEEWIDHGNANNGWSLRLSRPWRSDGGPHCGASGQKTAGEAIYQALTLGDGHAKEKSN